MFSLVDCNNFYASCERVFNPRLHQKPLIVLSNNDGCVIARSEEAKSLGVKMGVPVFEYKKLIKDKNIYIRSSNYSLYHDMSIRVVNTILKFVPDVEVYSIDEVFCNFKSMSLYDNIEFWLEISKKVHQWTGIPVSVGIGSTKTLAKLANKLAKNKKDSVCFLPSAIRNHSDLLNSISVRDVWGIGINTAKKLEKKGIKTVLSLAQIDLAKRHSHFNVTLLKIIMELKGIECFEFEPESISLRKTLVRSRSFKEPICDLENMISAVCLFGTYASEKLRSENCLSSQVTVFMNTSRYKDVSDQYFISKTIRFREPTNDTFEILKNIRLITSESWKNGYEYKKAGVMFSDIISSIYYQNFFNDLENRKVMSIVDSINKKIGPGTILPCSARDQRENVYSVGNFCSPRYTTCWFDFPVAY